MDRRYSNEAGEQSNRRTELGETFLFALYLAVKTDTVQCTDIAKML